MSFGEIYSLPLLLQSAAPAGVLLLGLAMALAVAVHRGRGGSTEAGVMAAYLRSAMLIGLLVALVGAAELAQAGLLAAFPPGVPHPTYGYKCGPGGCGPHPGPQSSAAQWLNSGLSKLVPGLLLFLVHAWLIRRRPLLERIGPVRAVYEWAGLLTSAAMLFGNLAIFMGAAASGLQGRSWDWTGFEAGPMLVAFGLAFAYFLWLRLQPHAPLEPMAEPVPAPPDPLT